MSIFSLFSYSRMRVWQLVCFIALSAWYIKFTTLIYAYNGHIALPFREHHLLGGWMLSPHFSLFIYMTPLLGVVGLIYPRRCWAVLGSVVLMVCSVLMLWNIHSYNDATFVVLFWVGVWLLWWASKTNDTEITNARWAIRLGLGVMGFLFLGGAVGKWTQAYWSGEAVYHIYFMQKDLFIYSWMRESLDENTLRGIACWFSRTLVVVESLWATLFLWPVRAACMATIILLLVMILGSTWMLYSVLGGIMGLSVGIWSIFHYEVGKN